MTIGTDATAQEMAAAALRAKVNQAYAENGRDLREEKLILDYLPLVRHVVQKIAAQVGPRADIDNLMSAGALGLVKAAKNYDASHDAEFKTYAYIRIRGAVLDELRGESFVPSSIHKQIRMLRQAYQRFTDGTGRPPGDEELAEELGVGVTQMYHTLEEARKQQFLSIHGLSSDQDSSSHLLPVDPGETPLDQVERGELIERLAAALKELPARDRQMILLYYERDLTMKEIAQVFEITESRVSQLHASALFKLSMKLRSRT